MGLGRIACGLRRRLTRLALSQEEMDAIVNTLCNIE